MSKTLITQYYNRVEKIIQFGGTKKETSVRNEFYNLRKRIYPLSMETMKIIGEMEKK
jgi:hypothetical protein